MESLWLLRSSSLPMNVWAVLYLAYSLSNPVCVCLSECSSAASDYSEVLPRLLKCLQCLKASHEKDKLDQHSALPWAGGTAHWPVTSVTRASSAVHPWRATWSSTGPEDLLPAFFAQNPLTTDLLERLMEPFISMMATSAAQLVRNGSRFYPGECPTAEMLRVLAARKKTAVFENWDGPLSVSFIPLDSNFSSWRMMSLQTAYKAKMIVTINCQNKTLAFKHLSYITGNKQSDLGLLFFKSLFIPANTHCL